MRNGLLRTLVFAGAIVGLWVLVIVVLLRSEAREFHAERRIYEALGRETMGKIDTLSKDHPVILARLYTLGVRVDTLETKFTRIERNLVDAARRPPRKP